MSVTTVIKTYILQDTDTQLNKMLIVSPMYHSILYIHNYWGMSVYAYYSNCFTET